MNGDRGELSDVSAETATLVKCLTRRRVAATREASEEGVVDKFIQFDSHVVFVVANVHVDVVVLLKGTCTIPGWIL